MAAAKFVPWNKSDWTPPSNEYWTRGAAVTMRGAFVLMLLTKAKPEEFAADSKQMDELVQNFAAMRRNLTACCEVLTFAETRLTCATLARMKRERPNEFAAFAA